jgi:spermidine synthase
MTLPRTGGRDGAALALCASAFVLSGAAGLVYQVAWQRILALHSGVGIYSVAAIVAAFMAGLGAGSYVGGRLSVSLGPRAALRGFALVELAIGAFGAVSGRLYFDMLDVRADVLYATSARMVLSHLLALFPPTFLMGLSLPLLVRGLVLDARAAGRTVGILYGLNLVGAALGAALTPWVLVRRWGIDGALFVAAAANVLAAVGGWIAGARPAATVDPAVADAGDAAVPASAPRTPLSVWVALYALSGFVALSLEIVWFRLLDVAVKSSAFTFGTLLALYLVGMAAGCVAMAVRRRPVAVPLAAFLACQCALLAYTGLFVLLLVGLPETAPGMARLYQFWGFGSFNFGRNWQWSAVLGLYVVFPLLLFGLPTVLMGVSFPVLQQAVHDDPRLVGRRVGLLQAANIAGCVAGSLLAALVGLGWLGTAGTLRLLVACGLVFAGVGLVLLRDRRFAVAGGLLAVIALLMPGQGRLWARVHGARPAEIRVEEDATSVSALVARPGSSQTGVAVQGKYHSWLPFGGIHTALGAVPAAIHPAPARVAIIGLGSGDTAWAAASRPETRSLTVFEIAGGQPRLLARAGAEGHYPSLTSFLRDPRLHVVVADGRRALEASRERYDLIEADALWPHVSYSGNLYSVEFFQACARRLSPGGLVCTWGPTERVYKTFTTVMPYVVGLPDREVLIGSNEPIPFERDQWLARLESPAVRAYLGEAGVGHSRYVLERLRPLHVTGRRHPTRELNWDLYPRDEFAVP